MDVSHILDSLNDEQRHAVANPSQHLLVLAGAGSGKTRVLVHRIAWLLEAEQVSPFSILAVTFTNKAAREMRHRIESLMGQSFGGMWVGTFHGLAHRLLRTHWQEAGLIQDFQILDSDDQLRLIKRINRELQIDDERWPAKQCQWYINGQKDEGLRASNIDDFGDDYTKTMLRIYRAYEIACDRGGMIDFGEILLRSHELWLKNPQILDHYQRRFQHILVDEFQDTNSIQYAWLRVLAGRGSHLMVVGDDDQSIYGWRGAKIENIQQFSSDFPGAQLVKLEQNYRSTKNILDAANSLITNNAGRLGKQLWTEGVAGEPISLYEAFNEQDESRFVVDRLQDWFNGGNRRIDSAVLYRSNAQSRELEEALLRVGMPYRIYGGQRFYERLEIKNALAYLRLVTNRFDDTAVERIINVPTRGIGGRTLELVRQVARDRNCSLWEASVASVNESLLTARAANSVLAFLELIDGLDESCRDLELHAKADLIIKTTGLIPHHEKEGGEKARARVENLEELVNAAGNFDVTDADEDFDSTSTQFLAAFLDQAALDAGEGQAAADEDAVQLMTLHTAKGLEFDLVFLVGMEEGLFPHKMSMDDLSGLEEERRLAYVGITRAKHKLYLSHAESRRLHGEINLCRPSRFVREIPKSLIEEVRLKSTISRPSVGGARLGRGNPSGNLDGSVEVPQTNLSLGQRVIHGKFGEGVVLNYEGQGTSARVQVNFDSAGSKWLVLSYAKLEVLA
ncbi:MAG: DNA helicase II [Gammaproteobacteria bacterium]|jgi:DNA helicase-2/ATP-dependent DNA helicase PcrA|nr:DNA helicase II [Gammaproteobacteria bacterium]MCH9795357.1 DNA helicase II [Gammaproteobacteria bacterium]MCH9853995.1 DNA helicase II [Gammaproteobacteria bacterium]MDA9568312.1 DNA helicase II [Gammaproteobacteria bacterium]MDB2483601.1 DNA helicase II [Gammaproteobacteria bacterium]